MKSDMISMTPEICIHNSAMNLKFEHYLKRDQTKMLNPQNQNNQRSLMLCIVEWRLLFAILHFRRRKFDHDVRIDYKLKLIFKEQIVF